MQQFNEPVMFYGRTKFIVLPDVNGDTAFLADTTPSVSGREVLVFKNTAPLTVTNLLNGDNFRTLKLIGDGQTTMKNNTTIKTNTGADKLLAVNKAYNFTLINNVWIEDA